MAIAGHTFDEVHQSKLDLQFCVYVIRLWEAPSKYNTKKFKALKWLLKIGQKIHFSITKGLITRWKVHLQEFKMFMITNLMVIDPKMKPKLRTILCTWYLGFSRRTTMEHLGAPIFHCNPFHFKTVPKLLEENIMLPNHTFGTGGLTVSSLGTWLIKCSLP
ncbi:hypothetical protein PIB30_101953 [Stylosanthes scabra]|uniref:Uncharacterized protein n=1 Tax=Stylosanthes scabra TaxID=79078 RepID=A0ABU6VXT5_9FABA|nr:hypothetical protein [Stylosanthes scabra]